MCFFSPWQCTGVRHTPPPNNDPSLGKEHAMRSHSAVCVCVQITVLFLGCGVESTAGRSLTERQPSGLPLCPSSSSSLQHVRKMCLQWKPRCWGASQRCPSRRNSSPREQQSQHSCWSNKTLKPVVRGLFFVHPGQKYNDNRHMDCRKNVLL